jgi:hypothetical protein
VAELAGVVAVGGALIRRVAVALFDGVSKTSLDEPPARAAPVSESHCPALVVAFVYELLDAHADTARIATDTGSDPSWAAHLAYLRALQRIGHELLARLPVDEYA